MSADHGEWTASEQQEWCESIAEYKSRATNSQELHALRRRQARFDWHCHTTPGYGVWDDWVQNVFGSERFSSLSAERKQQLWELVAPMLRCPGTMLQSGRYSVNVDYIFDALQRIA